MKVLISSFKFRLFSLIMNLCFSFLNSFKILISVSLYLWKLQSGFFPFVCILLLGTLLTIDAYNKLCCSGLERKQPNVRGRKLHLAVMMFRTRKITCTCISGRNYSAQETRAVKCDVRHHILSTRDISM